MNKLRIIKDYGKLDLDIQEQLKVAYPNGFSQYLIEFSNAKGEIVSALPFETETAIYMIRMTERMAERIIDLDDDYDTDGNLRDEAYEFIYDKYSNSDNLTEEEVMEE